MGTASATEEARIQKQYSLSRSEANIIKLFMVVIYECSLKTVECFLLASLSCLI
jgi:hypothetical protein